MWGAKKDDEKKPKIRIATGPDRQYGDGGDDSSFEREKAEQEHKKRRRGAW